MRRFYWVKEGLRFSAVVLMAGGLYGIFIALMNEENDTLGDILYMSALYLGMFGAFMSLIFNMGLYQSLLPLALSFGGTRREAMQGLQLCRIANLIPVVAAVALCAARQSEPFVEVTLMIAAGLLFSGLGGLVGSLAPVLSKGVLALVSAAAVLGGMVLIGAAAFLAVVAFGSSGGILWTILGISVLGYAVCSLFEARAVRHWCVR